VLLVGCAQGVAPTAEEGIEGKTVRFVFSSAPGAIDIVGVKITEILKEEGVNVDVTFLDGGAKAIQALLAGQADVASNAVDDAINSGLLAFALSRPRNMYAVVGEPGLDTLEEVEGKTLGAADPGSVANVFAEAIFKKHGISEDSLTWAQIGGSSSRTSALLSGKVDLALVYGDQHIALLNAGFETVTQVSDEFPGLHDDLWVASPDWLEDNEDLAVAIARAQLQAAEWFQNEPEEWVGLALETVEGIDEGVVRQFYDVAKGIDMYPTDGLMTEDSLTQTYQLFYDADAVEETELSAWSTTEYLDEAREQLGISAPGN
jgi:ABC-type nitrate/sulfonate/bicarbonate transport system substrate-binding protein